MTLFTTSKRFSAYWVSFNLAAGAADAERSPSCLEQDGSVYAAEERLSSPSFPGRMTLVSKCNGSHAAVDANCVEKVGHLFSYEGDLFDFFSSQWAKRLWRKGFSSLDLSSNATICQPLIAVFPTLVHQYRGNDRHRIVVVPARWKTLWRSRTLISSESRQPILRCLASWNKCTPGPAGWIIVTCDVKETMVRKENYPFLILFSGEWIITLYPESGLILSWTKMKFLKIVMEIRLALRNTSCVQEIRVLWSLPWLLIRRRSFSVPWPMPCVGTNSQLDNCWPDRYHSFLFTLHILKHPQCDNVRSLSDDVRIMIKKLKLTGDLLSIPSPGYKLL